MGDVFEPLETLEPLERSFYDRNAAKVAPALLGCTLVRRLGEVSLVGRIVEAEAYVGEHDLACHARAGRTSRTEVMYGPAGHAYVYLIYGIHQMLNCVCGPGSDANAVLIRAVERIEGTSEWLHRSATGPGNVCKAFGVSREHNRGDLCAPGAELFIAPPMPRARRVKRVRGPRIGVDYSGIWADELLRYCDAGSPAVSKPWPAGMRR